MLNKYKAGKLLILLLAMLLAFGAVPAMAENESATGTFYASLSDDGYFVISDGKKSGVAMAMIPVSLAEVSKIDLDEYGLGDYNYDPDGDGKNDITLLHVYVYLLENYYSGGTESLVVSGGPGSIFLNSFWGHDCNLTYYVNGTYPLESEGWGATADHVVVENGDFDTVGMITDWNFYGDPNAGHCYFGTLEGDIDWTQTATAGEDFQIRHIRSWGSIAVGGASEFAYDANVDVYYSKTLYGDDAEYTWTDDDGIATINFPSAGTWYVWTEGVTGQTTSGVVATPAYAKITVEEGEAAFVSGDADGDGVIKLADAQATLQYYMSGTANIDVKAADVNGDGSVTLADAQAILQMYMNR